VCAWVHDEREQGDSSGGEGAQKNDAECEQTTISTTTARHGVCVLVATTGAACTGVKNYS